MDTRTGEMVDMDYVKKLQQQNSPNAKWYKEIPNAFLPQLEGMNRKQRREWYRRNKDKMRTTP